MHKSSFTVAPVHEFASARNRNYIAAVTSDTNALETVWIDTTRHFEVDTATLGVDLSEICEVALPSCWIPPHQRSTTTNRYVRKRAQAWKAPQMLTGTGSPDIYVLVAHCNNDAVAFAQLIVAVFGSRTRDLESPDKGSVADVSHLDLRIVVVRLTK